MNLITPQVHLFAAISEPHGVDRTPSEIFPKYAWAMKWQNSPGMSITIHYSNNYDCRKTGNCKMFHISKMKLRFQTQ